MTAKLRIILFVLLGMSLPLATVAQTTTSILEGKVADATGAVLPGVTVEVKGSTVTRTVVTDSDGHYLAVALPAGAYTVTLSKEGFNTKVLQGITLVLDQTVTFDVALEVAPRKETVTVTTEVPLIDPTSASIRGVIESSVIDSIPLNGRNYLDLMQLLPGVATNANASLGGQAKDAVGAILGDRAGNATYMIDGLENNDDFHGGVLQAFTQDAIQEFEVIQAAYKAEFGRGSGGVVNVITKSGTNDLHGSGFFFYRNDIFDTSDVPGEPPPKLTRSDYGFTLGGPIRKNKAWFYGSLEEVQQTQGNIFPPDIPALLSANENFNISPTTNDLRTFGKYGQRINDKNDFRAELSWTRAVLKNELNDPVGLPSASLNNQTNTFLGKLSLTTIFSPHTFLDSSFGVRDQDFEQNQGQGFALSYSVLFLDDGTSYDFGPPIGSIQSLRQRYYTGREVLSFFPGSKHSVKVGFEYTRTQADGNNGPGALQSVILSTRPLFAQYGVPSFQIPQGIAFLNPGDNLSQLRNNGISFFGQDDWKVLDRLTLNLGLRWDYDSTFGDPKEFAPRLGLSYSPDKGRKTVIQASFGMFYDRYRIGVAQAVRALGGYNGQTVVYLDYPRLTIDNLLSLNPGSLTALSQTLGDPAFLYTHYNIAPGTLVDKSVIQSLTGMTSDQFLTSLNQYVATFGTYLPVSWDPITGYLSNNTTGSFADQIRVAQPFRTPYNNTFSVGVQRSIGGDVVIGATYIRRSIIDVMGIKITNLAYDSRITGVPTTTDGLPLQRTYGPWYNGNYQALLLTLNKRFGHRFQLMANYTYAQGTDDLLSSSLGIGIAEQGGTGPTDNLNLNLDRGNSDLLVPHSFVTSGLVDLPLGIKFSGISRLTSGVYFSAYCSPISVDGSGIYSLRCPGTTRNQFRGPLTYDLDLRLLKRFKIRERITTSVLAEVFNLTNARNPSVIQNFYVMGASGSFSPGPNFGGTLTPLPGREAQFGWKFEF
jgi:hypothetical protein